MPVDPTRIKEIFLAAAEQADEAARLEYLNRACGGEAELRKRVEALLRSHDRADSFLNVPAVVIPDPDNAGTMALDFSSAGGQVSAGGGRINPEREDKPDGLPFLTPSIRPDSLGRLDHYEILEVLGRGGFGIVFRAFDETLQRVVAIKVLAPELAVSSPARKRFLREAQSSAQVRHENVVRIYAVEEKPLPYLVMEFIPGETLQQRLDRNGPLDVPEVLQIGWQIAAGLAAAHDTGLIHRDIKPANILIETGPNAHVKITDFGLARAADDASLTQSGLVAGTPSYMAPEQARGEMLDHRADLFSLGSVLYTMCSGRPPFRANHSLAVLKRVVEDSPRPIPEIIPEVPQWLCDLIARLHAKNPAERFATSKEVSDLLQCGTGSPSPVANAASLPAAAPTENSPRWDAMTGVAVEFPILSPTVRPRLFARLRMTFAIVALLLGGLSLTEVSGVTDLRGTVIRLISPEGTLVVEVDDPDVSIKVDDSELVITGAGVKEIRMRPGQYRVQASKDGKILRQELVTVAKNGRQVVRISREEASSAPGGSDRRAAEYVTSIGGTMMIVEQGKERTLWPGNAVPQEPFDLRVVSLIDNQLATDAGMDNLKGCKYLAMLDLENTNISPAKIWELKNSLPSCTVIWDGDIKLLPGSPDRRATEFILSVGGTVSIKSGGIFRTVFSRRALPQGAFNLRLVDLTNNRKLTDADLALLKGCERNQSLILSGTNITDDGLAHVRDCKQLRGIDFSHTKVTDDGLANFNDHLSLTGVHLNATGITDAGLIHFKYCKNLAYLGLGDTQVSDDGLACFRDCKNLLRIGLARTKVSNGGLAHFKDCKSLEQIDLGDTQVSDAGLVHFQDCNDLAYIFLNGTKVTDAGMVHFKECAKLASLELSHTQVGDAGLAQFQDCKNLLHVDLSHSQVSDNGLAQLSGHPKLHTVNVKRTKVTEAGVKRLAVALPTCAIEWDGGMIKPTVSGDPDRRVVEWLYSPQTGNATFHIFSDNKELLFYNGSTLTDAPFKLRRLTIMRHPKVSDDTAAIFQGLRELTHLNIYECKVSDATLAAFKDCKQLRDLQLHGTSVTDAGVAQLASFSKLEYLNLNHTDVSETAIRSLAVALPQCKIEWDDGMIVPPRNGKSR